jgi:hypothetical protein
MLNRAVSSSTWMPGRWAEWRRGLSTRQAAILLRYVLVVAVLSAMGCLYIWQVNTISIISDETVTLEKQAKRMEAANVLLMEQLVRWQSPAYIDNRTRAVGMTQAKPAMVVKLSGVNMRQAAVSTESSPHRLIEAITAGVTR